MTCKKNETKVIIRTTILCIIGFIIGKIISGFIF